MDDRMRSKIQSPGPGDSHLQLVENWLVKILATGPGSNRSDFTERKRRRLKIN